MHGEYPEENVDNKKEEQWERGAVKGQWGGE